MPKIITCTGYGSSGSSAGTNFFEEFSNIKSFGSGVECTFFHESDGLIDLQNAIEEGHRFKVDLAVKRFLSLAYEFEKHGYNRIFNGKFLTYTKNYIEELCDCQWDGNWHRAFEAQKPTSENLLKYNVARYVFNNDYRKHTYNLYEGDGWKPTYMPFTNMYYTSDINFNQITKRYIAKLFFECDKENKYDYLLFDQLLPPTNVERYTDFFDFIKTISIDRDPRDLYYANKMYWGNRYIPTTDIDIFIKWFKQTRKNKKIEKSQNILHFLLEDFIYDYDNTRNKILSFTELKEGNHTQQYKFFNPQKSIVNTLLWKNTDFFATDIKKIEAELSEFCFDYSNIDTNHIEKKTQNFLFENAMLHADTLQKKGFSYKQKLKYCFFDMHDLRLGKKVKFIRENYKKNLLKEMAKLCILIIFSPFEWTIRFIKVLRIT